MMGKKNLIRKNILAAGILCMIIMSGTSMALAAEKNTETKSAAVSAGQAEKIALADAGVKESETKRLRTKSERENGESVYEVSFTADGTEYEYMIRRSDGKILEWEIDGRDIGDAVAEESIQTGSGQTGSGKTADDADADTQKDGDVLIGLERAKSIALEDAGLKAKNVRFSTLKFEEDRRETVYEIEFYQGRDEYEYTIDAYSGEILEMDRD